MNTQRSCNARWSVVLTAMVAVAVTLRVVEAQGTLGQGLIAHWAFDDAANPGLDSAGTHQGTMSGATLDLQVPPIPGNTSSLLLQVNGMTVAHAPDLTFVTGVPTSFSLWVKQTSFTWVYHIFGKRSGCGSWSGINYQLCRDSPGTGLFFASGDGGSASLYTPGGDLPQGQWCHVAFVYDGVHGSLYMQGTLRTTGQCSFSAPNQDDLVFGGSGTCGQCMPGLIDDVRLYNRALTPTEVAILAGGFLATSTPIGSGCPSSGGGNTLTATVLPWVDAMFHAAGTGLPSSAIVVAATSLTPIAQGLLPLASVLPQGVVGCDLLVAPDILEALVTTTGTAQSSLFLPNTPPLVGVVFYHQMVPIEFDGLGNWVAITATNALQLTAGIY